MSRILARKLRRDMRRQWPQFLATIVVVAIGVAVFVAASDAYTNLNRSFDRAYAGLRLPDVVLAGPGVDRLAEEAATLPGAPAAESREQIEVGGRVGEHTLLIRVVSVPVAAQPAVGRLSLSTGSLPGDGEVVVERHLADALSLGPGDTVELSGPDGWRRSPVSGVALTPEYFWPARSQQEVMTSADQFGVLFAPASVVASLGGEPEQQLALYATDRARAPELVAAATAMAERAGVSATPRSEMPSYVALDQDVQSFGQFAQMLPVLFLAAGALGAFVLLSRLVRAQRAIIGTLSANGVAGSTIRRHYLAYGVICGAVAAVPGAIAGLALGGWLTTLYTDALGLPLQVTSVHPSSLAVAAAAGVGASALAAWLPARAAARVEPAEAMRVAPAGGGHRSLLERVVPPVRRLPARWRMVLRGIVRNRRRSLLTVAGVAIALAIVLVFAGLRDTVVSVVDRQYGDIDRASGQLYAVPGQADALLTAAGDDPDVARAEPFSRSEVTYRAGAVTYASLLTGLPPGTEMHHFVAPGGATFTLPERGVLLAQGLANLLDVAPGDTVEITSAAGSTLTEPVVALVDEPMTAVGYASLDHLQAAGFTDVTGALVQLRPGSDPARAAQRLGALPGAAAYIDNASVEATMREAFAMMDVLVGVMLAFAVVMAGALLFNAMSANVAERSGELSTLNAAGMRTRMLGRLVAAENMGLTLAGIPIGLVAGILLGEWFMGSYETEGYRWALRLSPTTTALVVLGILAAAVVSQLPVLRHLHHLDIARIVRERSL